MTPPEETPAKLSAYGQRLASPHGIPAILQRAARARAEHGDAWIMDLNAGNPPIIDDVVALWQRAARAALDADIVPSTLSRYGHISGHPALARTFIETLAREGFTPQDDPLDHVLVTPGALSFIACAVHAFAGPTGGPGSRKLLLPQCPDFEGYRTLGLPDDAIVTIPSRPEPIGAHAFRYRLDWDALEAIDFSTIGVVVLSRPCNPTGGVLSGPEFARLARLAARHRVPVIADGAYMPPIPSLVYSDRPFDFVWADNVIHVFSMSKAGLPGERIGVAVGPAALLRPLRMVQAHLLIMSSKMGQAMAAHAMAENQLARVCQTVLRPHYQRKAAHLSACLAASMASDVPYRVHQLDGGVFSWIWFPEMPGTDLELLEATAREGLFFTPGSFFFDRSDAHLSDHRDRCVRISLTADPGIYERAMDVLARCVRAMRPG